MEDPEWVEAQKIVISIDLIAKTKKHLQFLKAIDDNGKLYNGPVLERAVFRYKYYWLPLLAKHKEEWQLVVPLDCEWIWHCHRLNPVRYAADSKQFFGRILDPYGMVISSVEGSCKEKTAKLWHKMHPKEPYQLDFDNCFHNEIENKSQSTEYDLVSAVKRQSSFYYQVSRASMEDDMFLEGAVERYKGFLHLIRRNMDKFCVPTYDIDLMWHTHQLNPNSYCKDMVSLLGKVLDHDDTEKGQKLDLGFTRTTNQWRQVFSSRYWRAGAMYGHPPPISPYNPTRSYQIMFLEILMEIIEVRNLSMSYEGDLVLSIRKRQHDMLFKGNRKFTFCTKTENTQVVMLQCEAKGELLFELIDGSSKSLGTCSISLSELDSKLATTKWLEFKSDLPRLITLGMVFSTTSPSPMQHIITKFDEDGGVSGCGTKCVATDVLENGGMCSGSGGCGGGGGGGGCRASCGGCRSSCGGGCRGGGGCGNSSESNRVTN